MIETETRVAKKRNIDNRPSSSKEFKINAVKFIGTWNMSKWWNELPLGPHEMQGYLEDCVQTWVRRTPQIESYILALEFGENGSTPHIQGVFIFRSKVHIRAGRSAFTYEKDGRKITPAFTFPKEDSKEKPNAFRVRLDEARMVIYCMKEGLNHATNLSKPKLSAYWDLIVKQDPGFIKVHYEEQIPDWVKSEEDFGEDTASTSSTDEVKFQLRLIEIFRHDGYEAARKFFETTHPITFLRTGFELLRNLSLMTTATTSTEPKYPLSSFVHTNVHPSISKWFQEGANTCLYVEGVTELGKTNYLIAKAREMGTVLVVSLAEELKRYSNHDFIIFDDFSFEAAAKGSPESLVHYLDMDYPRTVNVKYGSVTLTPGTKRIITSNRSMQSRLDAMAIESATAKAVLRRLTQVKQVKKLYNCVDEEQLVDSETDEIASISRQLSLQSKRRLLLAAQKLHSEGRSFRSRSPVNERLMSPSSVSVFNRMIEAANPPAPATIATPFAAQSHLERYMQERRNRGIVDDEDP